MRQIMQVLSVRGQRSSLKVSRAPFRREAETDLTDTPLQRRTRKISSSPTTREPNDGSDRDPQQPHPERAHGHETSPREVPRPTAASVRRSDADSAATVVGSDRTFTLESRLAS